MNTFTLASSGRDAARHVSSSTAAWALTSLRRLYRAHVYGTPRCSHAVALAVPVAAAVLWTLKLSVREPRGPRDAVVLWVLARRAAISSIGGGGASQGVHDQRLKDLLPISRASSAQLRTLFPPPTYERLDDFAFAPTGILPVGLTAVGAYYRDLCRRDRDAAEGLDDAIVLQEFVDGVA